MSCERSINSLPYSLNRNFKNAGIQRPVSICTQPCESSMPSLQVWRGGLCPLGGYILQLCVGRERVVPLKMSAQHPSPDLRELYKLIWQEALCFVARVYFCLKWGRGCRGEGGCDSQGPGWAWWSMLVDVVDTVRGQAGREVKSILKKSHATTTYIIYDRPYIWAVHSNIHPSWKINDKHTLPKLYAIRHSEPVKWIVFWKITYNNVYNIVFWKNHIQYAWYHRPMYILHDELCSQRCEGGRE